MKKLHVMTKDGWKMVFCNLDGKVITTNDKKKALPTNRLWANDDLQYFSKKFGNSEFKIINV